MSNPKNLPSLAICLGIHRGQSSFVVSVLNQQQAPNHPSIPQLAAVLKCFACTHIQPLQRIQSAHVPRCLFYSDLLLASNTLIATQYAESVSRTLCTSERLSDHGAKSWEGKVCVNMPVSCSLPVTLQLLSRSTIQHDLHFPRTSRPSEALSNFLGITTQS